MNPLSKQYYVYMGVLSMCSTLHFETLNDKGHHLIYVIVILRYEYDIVVITWVRGEAEYEC